MRYWLTICLLLVSGRLLAFELDGHTDFAQLMIVNSSISGRVESIEVVPGQRVASGDLLLRLDATGLRANTAMAQAEVEALQPELARVQTELDKAQELFDRDSLALVDLQTAEQNHAIAAARLAAAEARLTRAQYRLSQSEIRAPASAVVISVDTYAGHFINTRVSDPGLVTLADRRRMLAAALLPLELYSDGLLQREARVSFGDRQYRGKVLRIGSRITAGDNNHPALHLVVEFESKKDLPAGLPVKISIDD